MTTTREDAEIKNAIVTHTRLGVAHTDHGILSFSITLDFGASRWAFGGWVLDDGDADGGRRIPTRMGSSLLLGIDQLFGCDWEDLIGKPCRVYIRAERIFALGHYLKDKWMWFEPVLNEFAVSPLAGMEALAKRGMGKE